LDEARLRTLVKRQIEAGVDFLVPCGTTGESPTLTEAEHRRVVEVTVESARGKIPVLAGAGGYNTAEVICRARELAALDVKAALLYQQALTVVVDKNEFQGERQTWLAERDVCTEKSCLVTAYNNRIKELQRWVSP